MLNAVLNGLIIVTVSASSCSHHGDHWHFHHHDIGSDLSLKTGACGTPGTCPLPRPPPIRTTPAFSRVPLGSIAPTGWLLDQLIIQANGMAGSYQALYYPLVNESKWMLGGTHENQPLQWATYWLNGNVPLASLLEASVGASEKLNHDLGKLVDRTIAFILKSQQPDGTLGPEAWSVFGSFLCSTQNIYLKFVQYLILVC